LCCCQFPSHYPTAFTVSGGVVAVCAARRSTSMNIHAHRNDRLRREFQERQWVRGRSQSLLLGEVTAKTPRSSASLAALVVWRLASDARGNLNAPSSRSEFRRHSNQASGICSNPLTSSPHSTLRLNANPKPASLAVYNTVCCFLFCQFSPDSEIVSVRVSLEKS
jgi:hypothetical protein